MSISRIVRIMNAGVLMNDVCPPITGEVIVLVEPLMVSVYVSVEMVLEEFERITTLSVSARKKEIPPPTKQMAARTVR
jgi:hypothetical protein